MGYRYIIRNIIQTSSYPSVPRMVCTHRVYLVCPRQATPPWGVLPTISAISHCTCYSLPKYNFLKPCNFYRSQLKKWCVYFLLLLTSCSFTCLPDGLPLPPQQKKLWSSSSDWHGYVNHQRSLFNNNRKVFWLQLCFSWRVISATTMITLCFVIYHPLDHFFMKSLPTVGSHLIKTQYVLNPRDSVCPERATQILSFTLQASLVTSQKTEWAPRP